MNAVLEFQKALLTTLRDDATLTALAGADAVHDHVPPSASFPYLTLGRSSAYDWSTGTESGCESIVTVHVWSKAHGRKQVLEIMDAVAACLDAQPPQPQGHVLVSLVHEFTEARFDDDLDGYRGTLRYRALIEPAI